MLNDARPLSISPHAPRMVIAVYPGIVPGVMSIVAELINATECGDGSVMVGRCDGACSLQIAVRGHARR